MAVTDGQMDLEKLRALMENMAASGPERYGLSWAGKSDALKTLRQQTTATLLPAPSESVNWDTTGNAIIEGDNLEVLKVLQHAYHGKVKLIYIDPPYNTGGDFIYPDDYAEGLNSYLQFTRQASEEGVKLTTNVNTNRRSGRSRATVALEDTFHRNVARCGHHKSNSSCKGSSSGGLVGQKLRGRSRLPDRFGAQHCG